MFIFLSYSIDINTPFYGGGKGFTSVSSRSIEKGDTANTSKWNFPNHLGTHIDFPYHFYQNGQTSDDFPANFWFFNEKSIQILKVNLSDDDLLIKPEHIADKDCNFDAEFLILKTGFGKFRNKEKYWKYNPGLSMELSDWIKNFFKKVRIVGLDSISISSWQHRDVGRKVHRKLLNPKKPILIIEDMDLSKISNNMKLKMVYVAPIMVRKTNGAPCTIFAEVKNIE